MDLSFHFHCLSVFLVSVGPSVRQRKEFYQSSEYFLWLRGQMVTVMVPGWFWKCDPPWRR